MGSWTPNWVVTNSKSSAKADAFLQVTKTWVGVMFDVTERGFC